MRKISQREARRNRQQLEALRAEIRSQRKIWGQEYRGAEIARRTFDSTFEPEVVRTARKLGHVVVVVGDDSNTLRFVALPHPSEPII